MTAGDRMRELAREIIAAAVSDPGLRDVLDHALSDVLTAHLLPVSMAEQDRLVIETYARTMLERRTSA